MKSSTTGYSISDLYSLVNRFDKDSHAEKPVNPALLNEDGTPKVLYHGTKLFGLPVFNDREPIFFSDNLEVARSYSGANSIERLNGKRKTVDVDRLSPNEFADFMTEFNGEGWAF